MKQVITVLILVVSCAKYSEAQWTPDPFCPFPSDHVTRYPYYGNCSVYWECYEGTKYVVECPEGLEFNAPLQECDAPEIANCDPLAPTTANPNPPTYTTGATSSHEPGPDCPPGSTDEIFFPYEGNCTLYWECYAGDHYLYVCPPGLWWHQDISQCDYPGDYCYSTGTPTGSTSSGSTEPVTPVTPVTQPNCTGTGEDPVFYPYEGDCTKYWECTNGEAFVQDCPEGLWWNPTANQCDYPGDYCNSNSTGRPTNPTNGPTVKPTVPPEEPDCTGTGSDPVYYPYAGDCTKYYECTNGRLFVYSCPEGLWWNPTDSQCDYPGDYCTNSKFNLWSILKSFFQ